MAVVLSHQLHGGLTMEKTGSGLQHTAHQMMVVASLMTSRFIKFLAKGGDDVLRKGIYPILQHSMHLVAVE